MLLNTNAGDSLPQPTRIFWFKMPIVIILMKIFNQKYPVPLLRIPGLGLWTSAKPGKTEPSQRVMELPVRDL